MPDTVGGGGVAVVVGAATVTTGVPPLVVVSPPQPDKNALSGKISPNVVGIIFRTIHPI